MPRVLSMNEGKNLELLGRVNTALALNGQPVASPFTNELRREIITLLSGDPVTHINRYQVVRTGFWWRVKIGDGTQTVGRCYTEAEAQRLAAALLRAFMDGQAVSDAPRTDDAVLRLARLVEAEHKSNGG